jgi:putative FmdB family regulatory protein
MPTYEYRCENGHTFEALQSMSEDALSTCEVCGAPCQRLLSAPAIHYKGSGFYTTDYARKGKKAGASSNSGSGSSSSDGGSSSSSGSSDSGSKSSDKGSSSSSSSSGSSSKSSD